MQTIQKLRIITLAALSAASLISPFVPTHAAPRPDPIPVILDTDIGDDIDDTWALGLLLQSPELDLKLVVGDYGKVDYRAALLAKFLQTVHRTEVPVGMGMDAGPHGDGGQAKWLTNFSLASYPGKIHRDGVGAMIDVIMKSPKPVTLICIAPMPNIAAALAREPAIAQRARFVGMQGAVRLGYDASPKVIPEWNVKADIAACQKAFVAPWDMTITPLDTCGIVRLDGETYRRMLDSTDPIAATVIENYRIWSRAGDAKSTAAETHSSTLFDTVAVYLAVQQKFCQMDEIGLRVTDAGLTVPDDRAKKIHVATAWKDLNGYRDWLVDRLTGMQRNR